MPLVDGTSSRSRLKHIVEVSDISREEGMKYLESGGVPSKVASEMISYVCWYCVPSKPATTAPLELTSMKYCTGDDALLNHDHALLHHDPDPPTHVEIQ